MRSFFLIKDSSRSYGLFCEILNLATEERDPLMIFKWDFAYGNYLPSSDQVTLPNLISANSFLLSCQGLCFIYPWKDYLTAPSYV